MRVVLDATALVRAHPASNSTARKVLDALVRSVHTIVLSNEIIAETTRVLRYPRLQKLHALADAELYDYAQFLRSISEIVVLSQPYHAPLRDPKDLDVMQTAEGGAADVLCTNDSHFHEPVMIAYCAEHGIAVCDEAVLLTRLIHATL